MVPIEESNKDLVIPREKIAVFSGRSHLKLGKDIAELLGLGLGEIDISTFANGEIYCRVKQSVRGCDVFVIQTLYHPVNENLLELLIIVDALKRASAERITAVIPHYGYARQDKKTKSREPITAKLIADLMTKAGIHRMITMDLHAGQIQGFFDCPVDHLIALPILMDYLRERYGAEISDWMVCAPDVGRVKTAKKAADFIGAGLCVLHKERPGHNVAKITRVVGEVKDKDILIVDDMIDTAGTVVSGAKALMEAGAKSVSAAATHGIFSGPAVERLKDSPLKEIVVTDTVPFYNHTKIPRTTVVSVAGLFARTIRNVHEDISVSSLFKGLDHV